MPLNINPPNFPGLGGVGNAQISNPGALGLQAYQLSQADREMAQRKMLEQAQMRQQAAQAAQQAAQRQQEMQQTGAYQQGLLSQSGQDQALRRQGLLQDAQQGAAQQAYQQQNLAQTGELGRAGIDVDKQRLAQEQQAKEMAKLLDLNKQDRQERGAFAAYSASALKNAKSPQEAEMIRAEILKEAEKKGYYSKEQLEQARTMPLSQLGRVAERETMIFDAVENFAAMQKANTESKPGTFSFTTQNGDTFSYVSPESKTKGNAENELGLTNMSLTTMTNLLKTVPREFFGPQAVGPEYVTPLRNWVSAIPGLSKLKPSEKENDAAKLFAKVNGEVNRMAMDTIKQESGLAYTDQQLAFMMKFIPSIGTGDTYETFEGKTTGLIEYLNRVKIAKETVIARGIPISSDPNSKFGKELLTELQNTANTIGTNSYSPEIESAIQQNMNAYGYTKEEAVNLMKNKGIIK